MSKKDDWYAFRSEVLRFEYCSEGARAYTVRLWCRQMIGGNRRPTRGQRWKAVHFNFGKPSRSPSSSAQFLSTRQSADKELLSGFVAAAFLTCEFGFGGDEPAFDGGFEDGGLVALEVGLDTLQVGDGFVETGELLFDFGDDAVLPVEIDQ